MQETQTDKAKTKEGKKEADEEPESKTQEDSRGDRKGGAPSPPSSLTKTKQVCCMRHLDRAQTPSKSGKSILHSLNNVGILIKLGLLGEF